MAKFFVQTESELKIALSSAGFLQMFNIQHMYFFLQPEPRKPMPQMP